MDNFDNIIGRIIKITTISGCAAMILMMLLVVFNIISRIFGRPYIGTYEAVTLLVVMMAAFSISYAALENAHVKVDSLVIHLSKTNQMILYIITAILSLGIWILIAVFSAIFSIHMLNIGEGTMIMEWPFFPFRIMLVLGAILVCLVMISNIIRRIQRPNG